MADFQTDNGTIAYEIIESAQGDSAPWLTLLHSFMSTGRAAWGPALPTLSKHWRILLPDLPGHGASIGYPANFDHRVIAEQLSALMHSLGAEDGHLAGCSSGGMVAQRLVQHGMVTPRSLTLVSTTYSTNPARTGVYDPVTPERFKAGRNWLAATAKLHDPIQGEGYFDTILLPGFRALTASMTVDLSPKEMKAIETPICIIQGEQDEFFPPVIVQQMAVAYPNIEVNMIPDQTHALLFRAPGKVAEIMQSFLAAQDRQAELPLEEAPIAEKAG